MAFYNAFLGDGGSLLQEVEYLEQCDDCPPVLTTYRTEYSWNVDADGNAETLTVSEHAEDNEVYEAYTEYYKDRTVYTYSNGYEQTRNSYREPGMGLLYPLFILESTITTSSVESSGDNKKLTFSINPKYMELTDKYMVYNPYKTFGGNPDFVTVEATIDANGEFLELTYFYQFTAVPPDFYADEIFIEGKVSAYNIKKGRTEIAYSPRGEENEYTSDNKH
jgi:hypothetical protein